MWSAAENVQHRKGVQPGLLNWRAFLEKEKKKKKKKKKMAEPDLSKS